MMTEYDNAGRAVAWKNDPDRADKPLNIRCYAHRALKRGEQFEVAVWEERSKREPSHPDYTGKVQDRWKPRANYNSNAPRDAEFDDDIPF